MKQTRILVLLVGTIAVASGLNEMTPNFPVEFHSFGGPSMYREQRLPDRVSGRSFRDPSQPQLQPFRDETYREYRQPFNGPDESRLFHETNRFNVDPRILKDDNREFLRDEFRRYNEDSSPFRPDDSRIFKDNIPNFGDESGLYREGKPFIEESRTFYDSLRNLRDERPIIDGRIQYRPYRDEFRTFRDESKPLQDDSRNHDNSQHLFRNEQKTFRDDIRTLKDEKPCRDETASQKNSMRPLKDESKNGQSNDDTAPKKNGLKTFNEESGSFKNGLRPFNEESGSLKNGLRPFNEESSSLKNGLRPFNDESVPFRNDPRQFRDDFGSFRDESRHYKNGPRLYKDEQLRNEPRPYKEQISSYRNEHRPYQDESGPLRSETRPFREDPRPFKDEMLFTQESQSLAEAHHRYNKEQMYRQPLSFGGHSNYLKFGNHGLGFASVPAAVLPLEDNSNQRLTGVTRSDQSFNSVTQSTGAPSSSSPDLSDSKNQYPVTQAPNIGSTSSQFPSGNTIDSNTVHNERKNEKLVGEGSTSQASTAMTTSTSSETSVTPKMVFNSGSASASNSPMGITSVNGGSGMQQANTVTTNSLHASRQPMQVVPMRNTYSPSDTNAEVPAALLNYVFKYQMPQETKVRYIFRPSQPSENLNHIQTVPLVQHHQTTKYSFLPEFKIPTTSATATTAAAAIHQPGGSINYVSNTDLPKVSYFNTNSAPLTLGTNYLNDNPQSVNIGQNLIQLDQGNPFSHLGQVEQLSPQLRPIGSSEQFPQFRQLLTSPTYLNQLGQYGQFGQTEQPRINSFNQGGLPLQLGGFGGIDYNALTSNSETSRISQSPVGLWGLQKWAQV